MSAVAERTFGAGTPRKVNNIRDMEVFQQTGLKIIDCGEDDGNLSDAETEYGSPADDWSESEDGDYDSWDVLNGHEQLVNILNNIEKTGITREDVNRLWWGDCDNQPRICRAITGGTYNPCKRLKGKDAEADKVRGNLLPSLQSVSAMLLMTVLYAARVARYDLFKPINFLAKRITKWDERCDKRLHQLMSYINESADQVMLGFVGDDDEMSDLGIHLY